MSSSSGKMHFIQTNMYRKQWTLSTDNTDWVNNADLPHIPLLKITFDGSISECHKHLSETSLVRQMPSTVAVTFRLQAEQDGLNVDGILGIANTRGDYIIECEGHGGQVLEIVDVANQYADRLNDMGQYELWIEANDGLVKRWVEVALILYSAEGKVLREQCLIPPGLDI
jgi:hypothetical protein